MAIFRYRDDNGAFAKANKRFGATTLHARHADFGDNAHPVAAFDTLASAGKHLSLSAMLEPVTEQLGNTPAIARKSHVHPRLIALIKQGQARFRKALRPPPRAAHHFSRAEPGLIAVLRDDPAAKAA